MKPIHRLGLLATLVVLAACTSAPVQKASEGGSELQVQGGADGIVRQLPSTGAVTFRALPEGVDNGLQNPEFSPISGLGEGSVTGQGLGGKVQINRSIFKGQRGRSAATVEPTGIGGGVSLQRQGLPSPQLLGSFDGLNHRQSRLANGGNQFSTEPPDQGLCVGNGFVLESVNTVLRVYDTAGNALTGAVDFNTFYGYPPAINRTTGRYGQYIYDPSCLYDSATGRWFAVTSSFAVKPDTGDFTGQTFLELAVSQTSDPTGAWTIYHLDTTNDGGNCPCLPDYPQIGADANGFYIATNSFPVFANGYNTAFIYAFPKKALASGASSVPLEVFQTQDPLGNPGFTVRPSVSPDAAFSRVAGGTEYFISSLAVNYDSGLDNRLVVWALTNTRLLNQIANPLAPRPKLSSKVVTINPYGVPEPVDQKAGDFPLGQCINDTTLDTPLGKGCWRYLFTKEPAHDEKLAQLDSSDTRVFRVTYLNGQLWGTLGTALSVGGKQKAGVAWFVLEPQLKTTGVEVSVANQGYVGVLNNNLIYPTLAVNKSGKGIISFTLVGVDYYPSLAFVGVNAQGTGAVQIVKEGLGPQDGFSGYKAYGNPPRPRWGDYGAATPDEQGNIWFAQEYIGQTCTLAQYASAPFGSCGGTRTTLANWGTRIGQAAP